MDAIRVMYDPLHCTSDRLSSHCVYSRLYSCFPVESIHRTVSFRPDTTGHIMYSLSPLTALELIMPACCCTVSTFIELNVKIGIYSSDSESNSNNVLNHPYKALLFPSSQ